MKGTEKQIKFAERLVEKFDNVMSDLIDQCPEQYKRTWVTTKEMIDKIFAEAYAGDVIDILKNNNEENAQKYYTTFYSRLMPNADKTSARIKKEVYGK